MGESSSVYSTEKLAGATQEHKHFEILKNMCPCSLCNMCVRDDRFIQYEMKLSYPYFCNSYILTYLQILFL